MGGLHVSDTRRHLVQIVAALVLTVALSHADEPPAPRFVLDALDTMHTGFPTGWACTISFRRNGQQTVEVFDPALPPGRQWSLVSRNGYPASGAEHSKYAADAARQDEPPFRAGFNLDQIDPSSLRVIRENARMVTVAAGFTRHATDGDKMLRHLDLELVVRRSPAAVAGFRLRLRSPYSPVLTVKMNWINAGADFDELGRPVRQFSHFSGTILFRTVNEDIDARFLSYRPSGTGSSPAQHP